MTAITYHLVDSATLFRRNLKRLRRYPSMTVLLIGMPIVFLLLFDGVFGAQLSRGLGSALSGGHLGRAAYLNYLTPGILLVMVAASVQGTAISVAMDMTGAIGIVLLFAFALVWLATALGLAAKSVETASNTPMFLTLLPFLGIGFVRTATMPDGLRQFAEYQPFTPVTETVRGLLTGTGIGSNAIAAVGWSLGIALVSYLWARNRYENHRPR